MLTVFKEHIEKRGLLSPSKTYLLACSGGVDSMVLAHLLLEIGISFEIGHVNFGLRGAESDADESSIEKWSNENSIPFHSHHPDTTSKATDEKISIQMAARDIRYAWFDDLIKKRSLDGIVLAHHQDDQLETIFLNLLRTTGLDGIQGMADKKGYLIRPLLPFSKEEILAFAKEKGITWREDASNQKTEYKRNKLRLEALPALYEVSEDAKQNLLSSFNRLQDAGKALGGLSEIWLGQNLQKDSEVESLPFRSFINQAGATTLLFYWLRSYGFNSDQAESTLHSAKNQESGKVFFSATHQLTVDREALLLAPISEGFDPIILDEKDIELVLPEGTYELLKEPFDRKIDTSRLNAQLDLDRLSFPLTIRTWELGDKFIPLGMKNGKKVSDFLIDLKIDRWHKDQVKVLVSEGKIAWVIGHRIADWAKCDEATRVALHFKKKN
ncbi:tRNA lysidine(34) synthetase TilS [Algoriphagus marincola]|uniref:tRNA(Ile)-lysidine synthase n=1 Tax=Algoriphagus marincola TaxID=264027 RepID=A0ABS7N7K9_9BACT|nr:tRNA lysidine(34) synthetase TilS [Algoriphagus marincola]MBY5952316.1 tRNA lysidine(34) synthetase TilS [Algoriphagus marincola]